MFRTVFRTAVVLAFVASGGLAQSRLTPQERTAPLTFRGTYHVARGTWSRSSPGASFNSGVLYNNSAPSGYFFETTAASTHVDHGRLPSTYSPSNPSSVTGTANRYSVDCFEVAYCSSIPSAAGGLAVVTGFYDEYAPCSDIGAPGVSPVASFLTSGLPGGTATGAQACWVVAFDLSNTTLTFSLDGDADGNWDGVPSLDSFGWSSRYLDADDTNHTGPIAAGHCPAGGVTIPQQGFGTKFGGTPGATDATGLGTDDFFWIDGPAFPMANGGCFFFGGCPGVPVGANPFSSFWCKIFGSERQAAVGTNHCFSLINATGSRAVISASATDTNQDLVLSASPVPNTTGQFYFGPMSCCGVQPVSLGDGLRCVGGMTTRLLPFVSAGMMMQPPNTASFALDYSAPYASNLHDFSHFQYWFRSGLPSGQGSNSSDGIRIQF